MRHLFRVAALVLSLVMLLSVMSLGGSALSNGDFTYEINENGTAVTITAYTGSDTTVTVPDTIDGLPVTVIGERAFENLTTMTQVVFPNGLQIIDTAAFYGCTALTSVDFPDSLQRIAEQAFYNCYKLSTIDIGPYTYDIGYQAFTMTTWLNDAEWGPLYLGRVLYTYNGGMFTDTEVIIKDGTAAIAPFAFQNRDKLVSVQIPVGLRTIGAMAFLNCNALAEIRIPPSVQSIGSGAFLNASSATVYGVRGSVTENYASENNLFFAHDSTLDYPDGDMNKDGVVTSTDVRKMLRVVTESGDDYDHERYLSCDIVYDGTIDTADIRAYLIKLVTRQ